MPSDLQVIVDDSEIGIVQRKLLADRVKRQLGERMPITWISESAFTANWAVKPSVAKRLASRIAAIADGMQVSKSLYLDGNMIIQGNLEELVEVAGDASILAGNERHLGRISDFLVRHDMGAHCAIAARVVGLNDATYDTAANFEVDAGYLPDYWQRTPFITDPDSAIVDCRRLDHRPWYRPNAPGWRLWSAQVYDAIEAGVVTGADLYADVESKRIRPSMRLAGDDPAHLKRPVDATMADIDASFLPPEMAPSAEQIATIRQTKFPLPRRIGVDAKKAKVRRTPATNRKKWKVAEPGSAIDAAGIRAGYAEPRRDTGWYVRYLIGLSGRAVRDPRRYAKRLAQVLLSATKVRKYD